MHLLVVDFCAEQTHLSLTEAKTYLAKSLHFSFNANFSHHDAHGSFSAQPL